MADQVAATSPTTTTTSTLTSTLTTTQFKLVHYHKTGHHLSRLLAEELVAAGAGMLKIRQHNYSAECPRSRHTQCRNGLRRTTKRGCYCEKVQCVGQLHVVGRNRTERTNTTIDVITAPQLWQRTAPLPSCVKVVHMVRDPAHWAISYYDYHRQIPLAESWVTRINATCRLKETLTIPQGHGITTMQLHRASEACIALIGDSNVTFHHALQHLPEVDGLRFVAFMLILHTRDDQQQPCSGVGDLLRAAFNAHTLRSHGVDVFTMHMDQTNKHVKEVLGRLAAFVSRAIGQDGMAAPLAEKMVAAERAAMARPIDAKHFTSIANTSSPRDHAKATSALSARSARLAALLTHDPVVGPIFAACRRMLSSAS